MSKRTVVTVLGVIVLLAALASLAYAAGAAQYQFTGTITAVDAQTMTVEKGKEKWNFSLEGMQGVTAKTGDKVTVYYHMVANKIEAKAETKKK